MPKVVPTEAGTESAALASASASATTGGVLLEQHDSGIVAINNSGGNLDAAPIQANDDTAASNPVARTPIKCSIKGCQIRDAGVQQLEICSNYGCSREVHYQCYIHCVQMRSKGKIPNPVGELVDKGFCTQKCYKEYKSAGAYGQNWHDDGANGKDDPNCSENLLVSMYLSSETEYYKFRNPAPLTKEAICKRWAQGINSKGVRRKRSGKDIYNKVDRIQKQMRNAQDWAEGTGKGLQETDPDRFEDKIRTYCKFWYELEEVFVKRASMVPLATTEEFKVGNINVLYH